MTLLDDDIDDLLRDFRADEARLDDDTRTRMWSRILDQVPDASEALDALAPVTTVRPLRRRRTASRARVLAVAAAVLVLIAVAGLAIRSGPGDDAVTAGPATTAPLPRTLQELADAVAIRPVTTLGSTPEARYSHAVVDRVIEVPGSETTVRTEEQWVALDGTGRMTVSGDRSDDEQYDEPGSLTLGALAPDVAVSLPDDAARAAAALAAATGGPDGPGLSNVTLTTLAHAGLPGPARAGLIRYLDRLGFEPVTAPGLAPTLVRVEGPGPDGSTVQADLDLLTGEVVASVFTLQRGGRDTRTYTTVDLRADTRSR